MGSRHTCEINARQAARASQIIDIRHPDLKQDPLTAIDQIQRIVNFDGMEAWIEVNYRHEEIIGKNFLISAVPFGISINLVKVAATGTSIGVGRTAMEAEIFNTQSKIRWAVAIDIDVGRKYAGYKGGTKRPHAQATFEAWAKDLRQMLDK